MNWNFVIQIVLPLSAAALGWLAHLSRFLGRPSRARKRQHDVVRLLRAADLQKDDKIHNLRLEAWYTRLTRTRFASAREIRYIAELEPVQEALFLYGSARWNLKLVRSETGAFRLVRRSPWKDRVLAAIAYPLNAVATVVMFVPAITSDMGLVHMPTRLLLQAQVVFLMICGGILLASLPVAAATYAVRRMLELQDEVPGNSTSPPQQPTLPPSSAGPSSQPALPS
jgi:hypothetical protein